MTASRTGLAVGVDLGGTKIQAAVVDVAAADPGGRVVASHRQDTDVEGGPAKAVDDIVHCIRACVADLSEIRTVGVGVAGQVDAANEDVRDGVSEIAIEDSRSGAGLDVEALRKTAVFSRESFRTLAGRGSPRSLLCAIHFGMPAL